ncbi:MAG: hypothetical protein ACRDOL_32260, partial [Streptosporangiaceae bacterium]
MRYRLELRLTAEDTGKRVVLRWRRPAEGGGEEVADVLGILEAAGQDSFTVRKASGEVVVIPRTLVLGGKTIPPAPRRARQPWQAGGISACLRPACTIPAGGLGVRLFAASEGGGPVERLDATLRSPPAARRPPCAAFG